jgi:TonB-linked SusC/RagA family outer membrane protein
MSTHRTMKFLFGAALAILVLAAPVAAQQTGAIGGVIRTETGEPVAGAQVSVVGIALGTITRDDGRFMLQGVPTGAQTVRVERIGYATSTQSVQVRAGETVTANITVRAEAIALDQIIVTGVAGATQRAKVPFEVGQLTAADMPVPNVNAVTAIRGKVAGATVVQGSGRPGAAPSVLLRGPTSISATGRDQEPLYIVDGVILGSSVVDIDGLDIENIEIVKGAAAASMYGSRAGAGVINITTRRGRDFADGQVRYTARSSFGQSSMPGEIAILKHTWWAVNADGTAFVRADGSDCTFRGTPAWDPNNECSGNMVSNLVDGPTRTHPVTGASVNIGPEWRRYATNPWPGPVFNHIDQFFTGGAFQEHYVGATGRQGNTNFLVSFSRQDDEGVMIGHRGFQRNNFRVNVDQVVRPELSVSASAFYSRSVQQGFGEGSGNSIFGLTRMQGGVDLRSCEPIRNFNPDGTPVLNPDGSQNFTRREGSCLNDPTNLLLNVNPTNTESKNPIYDLLVENNEQERGRFLASTNLRWQPTGWFDVQGDVSYDRLDREWVQSFPKGFRTLTASAVNEGDLWINNLIQESLNASVTASFRHHLADGITNRTQFRYLYEQSDNTSNTVSGTGFAVVDIPTLGNITGDLSGSSSLTLIRADGYFAITNFDLYDRYIIDALIRNDGSSLFGADERRQWYHRIAGAWRIAQEPWFNLGGVDELKLRASRGTAGGRPAFAAQYETFSVSAGSVIPVNLGNRDLRPEHSTEVELGIDAAFMNRFDVTLTRAITNTDNQIMAVPLPAFSGFSNQIQNVGSLESKTWEMSLGARLLQTRNVNWSARLLFDATESIITELSRPEFRTGVAGQNMGNVFLIREGEKLGTFYGPPVARSCADLPSGLPCDQFVVDQNGYLVWAPTGLDANAWGTLSGLSSGIGQNIPWGTPFAGVCTDRVSGEETNFCPVGNTMPDYTVALSSTLAWRGLSLYGLIETVQGVDVWNQPLQWALFRDNIEMMAEHGAQGKPTGYTKNLYGGLSGLVPNAEFVEDASFTKLREVQLAYRLTPEMLTAIPGLRGMSGIGLSLTGRNLLTWSDYRGIDPEVGRTGGGVGSAAIARVDGYNYPNFRTWTFGVEVNF